MEYGIAGAASVDRSYAESPTDKPYLARIGEMADEAERIGNYVEAFIDRCRGGGQGADGRGQSVPQPTGHIAQLARLTDNLSRIDKLARELQTIG